MTCFLSPNRQQKLTETLTALDIDHEQIQKFLDHLPDDLVQVDFEMYIHVQTVVFCRDQGANEEALT